MTCALVRRRLSEWIDGDLEPSLARRLEGHLSLCPECQQRARELRAVGRLVARLPRLEPPEAVGVQVANRIEMETEARRPGLVALFRGFSAARPFMLPSLVPAVLVLVTFLSGVLALDPGPLPEVHLAVGAWRAMPATGTVTNPFPAVDGELPRERTSVELPPEVLARRGEVFLETVVGRDGSVADVTVIDGDVVGRQALVDALRRQQFEPVRYRGRTVAVSVYRLISRVEVRSPLT
jgi:anti-sigma factor RsiW